MPTRTTKPTKKPQTVTPPRPELRVELDDHPPAKWFVVRNVPTGSWWGDGGHGYFESLLRAGTFTEQEARHFAAERNPVEDEAMPLEQAVREYLRDANDAVLQQLAAARAA